MSSTPRYFIQENGLATGPHSLAVLRQKADMHVITRDTPVAFADSPDTWMCLREQEALSDELFPRCTSFKLGPKAIETINRKGAGAPPTIEEILRDNLARQEAAAGALLAAQPAPPNRRLRDFWWLLAAGIALCMAPWLFIKLTLGLILLSLVAAACLSLCLVWMMFFVMDRY